MCKPDTKLETVLMCKAETKIRDPEKHLMFMEEGRANSELASHNPCG